MFLIQSSGYRLRVALALLTTFHQAEREQDLELRSWYKVQDHWLDLEAFPFLHIHRESCRMARQSPPQY